MAENYVIVETDIPDYMLTFIGATLRKIPGSPETVEIVGPKGEAIFTCPASRARVSTRDEVNRIIEEDAQWRSEQKN